MGRPKKYNTEEERKEARKLANKQYNAKNKDRKKASNDKWREENPNYQAELMSRIYYVYSHTNSKGKKYIGSGNRQRPYVLKGKNRTKGWLKVFDGDCKIKILGEFTDRQDAYIEEDRIIREIGLHKLVNKKHVTFV